MCGPLDCFVHAFDRARLNLVDFVCARLQRSKGKNASVVMQLCEGEVLVGIVQRFYQAQPPGVADTEPASFAHVHWLKPRGCNADLLGAPVVSRSQYHRARTGNLCLLADLIPVNASLVPHHSKEDCWQVLHHADCSFHRPQNIRPGG